MRHRSLFVAAVVTAFALASLPDRCGAGALSAYAEATGAQEITVSWSWWENPAHVVTRPEWVGYDVLRRVAGTCGYERVNTEIIPRTVGESHSRTFVDVPPSTHLTFEYRTVPVDASHAPVPMPFPDCESPCVPSGWASCPPASAPITVGILHDMGWALYVFPCVDACYSSFYFSGPMADELRTLGMVGSVVKLYGTGMWGTLEGPSLQPTAWEPGECGPTPNRATSWGRVKTIYR